MPRCKPRLGLRFKGARTTALRDHCRHQRTRQHLSRGGRTRTSAWWRAWIARLLSNDQPAAPPQSPPTPLSSAYNPSTDALSVTFDLPLDPESTVAASQLHYGSAIERFPGTGSVEILGTVLTVTVPTPVAIPFGSGAWLDPGIGVLRGENGLLVEPFGPV